MSEHNHRIKSFSRDLRKNMTKEEKHLWFDYLSKLPVTVRRQHIIGPYITDFCIPAAGLVIELDGSQHYEADGMEWDRRRGEFLRKQGYTVLRFPNCSFYGKESFDAVCRSIEEHLPGNIWGR